jgi:hypothetical protein
VGNGELAGAHSWLLVPGCWYFSIENEHQKSPISTEQPATSNIQSHPTEKHFFTISKYG